MNNLHNIASLHRPGVTNTPHGPSGGKDVQDLSGFLDQILQTLQADSDGKTAPKTQAAGISGTKDLKEKIAEILKKTEPLPSSTPEKTTNDVAARIAELLQKNNLVPEEMKNLSPEQLTAKIAEILQKTDLLATAPVIQPALTSDLVAQLSTQIQADTPKTPRPGDFTREIAALLDKIEPGQGDDTQKLEDILLQLQAVDTAPVIDPAILQQLKDKITQLQQTPGGVTPEVMAQFKADIIQSLTDHGIPPADVPKYLAALSRELKDEAANADAAVPDMTVQLTEVVKTKPKEILAAAPKILIPDEIPQKDARPLEAPKQAPPKINPDLSLRQDKAGPQAPAPVSAQSQPQKSLSEKISGCSISPGMVNALASSDGNFGQTDLGMNGNGHPQDLLNTLGILKPAGTDASNPQNFINYLSAARATPHAVTQMVNIQMQRNIMAKIDTMTLQLDPADLGRLDIKLKFDNEGGVRAHLSVEKPETLALLQRDSHHLEKVLQQSGLDIDEKSLSFDLRQQGRQPHLQGYGGNQKGHGEEFAAHVDGTASDKAIQAQIAVQAHGYISASGVNIMV